jgi:uncharacterized SAM-binding protein YcdF (DUF218 family)
MDVDYMFFLASKVVWFFLKPFNLLLAMIVTGLVARRLGWRRSGAWLLGFGILGFLVGAFTNIGSYPLRALEDRFEQPDLTAVPVDGIIVLGGAVGSTKMMEARNLPPLNNNAERMTEAVVLANRYPKARLAFAGYSGKLFPDQGSEAEVAKRFFRDMGLQPERLLFEDRSRNTAQNAQFLHDMIGPTAGEQWLLVTSAFHMPRSVGAFCAAGWPVVPYPVDYKTLPKGSFQLEDGTGLEQLSVALREWVGLAAYWLTGRTSSVFPGPSECRWPS